MSDINSNNKATYVLVYISLLDEVLYMSLVGLHDLINTINTCVKEIEIPENKVVEVLISLFDKHGSCIGYKKHLFTHNVPINTVIKRVQYSALMLLRT